MFVCIRPVQYFILLFQDRPKKFGPRFQTGHNHDFVILFEAAISLKPCENFNLKMREPKAILVLGNGDLNRFSSY